MHFLDISLTITLKMYIVFFYLYRKKAFNHGTWNTEEPVCWPWKWRQELLDHVQSDKTKLSWLVSKLILKGKMNHIFHFYNKSFFDFSYRKRSFTRMTKMSLYNKSSNTNWETFYSSSAWYSFKKCWRWTWSLSKRNQ